MPSVDNRVVRMEFDNAAFERKLQQTIKSLSQLDKSLQLKGAHKGLTDISAAAGKVNLNPIAQSAQGLSSSFLAMSTVAVTALATITSAAISAGASIARSLSLDPVVEGFREYEMNIGSIQTILANTRRDGTNLEQVNSALDELNRYSDQTIYNFAEMTKNIGTFTAAGVGLDTSVQSIKGVANLAAISGSNSQQASTAMYQLSQAIAANKATLVDWNSVVNAGMGGEVFQRALYNTGQALGTLTTAPVGMTFDEWTEAGNSFRDSLQDGWITGEVLTTTLQGFTGEMTEAQLLAIGYTREQAREIQELGRLGVESATKIRTFSQLMSTVKETVTSGWSQTFRTIFGDFEEATSLFTGINEAITGFVEHSAEARNEMLQGWEDLGGRLILIDALKNAFKALGDILRPIKEAFRDVFPPMTAERLFELTESFAEFVDTLKPSEATIENIRRIFTGLFSALDIGWETIKAGVGFIKDLVLEVTGLGSGNFLDGLASFADFFTNLREQLDGGEAIGRFFDNLGDALDNLPQLVNDLKDAFLGLFSGFDIGKDATKAAEAGVDRLRDRFTNFSGIFDSIRERMEGLREVGEAISEVLNDVSEAVSEWFSNLASELADSMGPGEFDAVVDAFNVGLLGGIGFIISRFLRGGFNFDLGGGLFGNISQSFEQLTGVLESLQTNIRADTLLKIAGALALLTASVVALSLIDSAALTRALVAMAVGFGQLMASFAILSAISAGIGTGFTFAIMAAGMILMASALVILAGAVTILSKLGWEELAKGLLAITLLLGGLTAASVILARNSGQIFLASLAMSAMGVALTILAGAVALFGQMDWGTLLKGFTGVAAGLLIMAGALHLMPDNIAGQGLGIILVATALNILARAVKEFAEMDWSEMARGLAGIAGGLLIIALAFRLMPSNMLSLSAGLVLVSVGLNILAKALEAFAGMSWSEIGKGLAVLAGSLLILAVALNAMNGTLAGSAALLVASVALGILAKVMIELGKVPFGDILKALGGLALVLGLLGGAAILLAPVAPALLALGAALALVGGAFLLFGLGALAVAKALEILSDIGPAAAETLEAALEALGQAIPSVLEGFARGVLEMFNVLVDAAPVIADGIGVLLSELITTLTELLPQVGELFVEIIATILRVVTEAAPDIIGAGLFLIVTFLQGLRDNIYQITDVTLELIVEFLNAIAQNIDQVTAAGISVLVAFLLGIASGVDLIIGAVGTIITTFILALGTLHQSIINAGVAVLVQFLKGIGDNLNKVVTAVGYVIVTFINAVANLAISIANAGASAIVNFANGMTNNAVKITNAVTTLITTFITQVSNSANRIITAGSNAILNFVTGLGRNASNLVTAGVNVVLSFLRGVASNTLRLASAAADIVIDFLNALAAVIREKSGELRQAGLNIAGAIIDGMTGGLASAAGDVASAALDVAQGALNTVTDFLGISSPSKVFMEIGRNMVQGMAIGIGDDAVLTRSATRTVTNVTRTFRDGIARALDLIEDDPNFNPTITPVLDLTRMQAESREISAMLKSTEAIRTSASFRGAQIIATTTRPVDDTASAPSGPTEVIFQQTINAPTELSAATIYRQTRNQITVAKEELSVP